MLRRLCLLATNTLDIYQIRRISLFISLWDTLLKRGFILDTIYHELFSKGSTPGILYAPPKVHKTNTPVRPTLR